MTWLSIERPPNPELITKVVLIKKKLREIPEWISECINLHELNCSHNQIIKIGNLPNNLQILYCNSNIIIKIENLPHNLQILHCSNNKIIKIENLPPNLQEFYCSDNKITKIENLPTDLQIFDCSYNQITTIDILPTDLQNFDCSNNKITKIENLPHGLQIFECYYNKITKIDNLPPNLQKLYFSGNQITELPLQLLELRNLISFDYSNNPIENIHPLIFRWLERQKNKSLQVYNDTQSVHNHSIQECIKKSIYNLLNDRIITPLEKVLDEIINDHILTDKVKEALIEYSRDLSMHSVIQITFGDLLIPVWSRIKKHEHKDEIKHIMNTEISDGLCKCFTGRISRLVNCLNGFCDDIEIHIGSNEQIGNIIVIIKEQLERTNEYTVERHREMVKTRLEEMQYSEDVIKEWLEFID